MDERFNAYLNLDHPYALTLLFFFSRFQEIPYASTYDGGLGCYPDGYSGNAADLYDKGSHHCVNTDDNKGK